MTRRAWLRLHDMAENIELIEGLLSKRTFAEFARDRIASAALERFLEIVSEASRNLPAKLTDAHPEVPWRKIADLGNVLRHVYHQADPAILWDIGRSHLPALKAAVQAMIRALGEDGG